MESKLNKFSIDLIDDIAEGEDEDFAILRLRVLSDGENAHGLKITEKMLKQGSKTLLGKFVVAKINAWKKDFEAHEDDEIIVGYIPKDSVINFVKSENGLFFEVDAVLSKLYAKDAIDIFRRDDTKSVSAEFVTTTSNDDEDIIESIDFKGVTLLGTNIKPSCKGAMAKIVKFNELEADDYYEIHVKSNLNKFAERRKIELTEENYKINKTELKDTPWGDVDKTELMNTVMNAKNKIALVKEVYALVEDGWEDAPSEHLKYPIMEINNNIFYYNRYGLSTALGYAKKENETKVITKIEKIYKNFNLDKDEKEEKEKMSKDVKFTASNIKDLWSTVYKAMRNYRPAEFYGIYGIYEDDKTKFAIIYKDDNAESLYRLDFTLNDNKCVLSDEIKEVEVSIVETDKVYKFEEPENSDEFKKFDNVNKFSYNAYLDVGAMNEMIENETCQYKDLVKTNLQMEDMNIIMNKFVCELKNKDARIKELEECNEKEKLINETFEKLPKEISKEKTEEFTEKAKLVKLADFNNWQMEVKLYSYENGVTKIEKFADNHILLSPEVNDGLTSDPIDVFDKYLRKEKKEVK